MHDVFTADDARHWALLTRAALAARRREIDALNVYPVPDGDTGTNLYLTLDGALDQIVEAHTRSGLLGTATLVQECESLSRAALLAARGNSGVILSQILRGLSQVVIEGAYAVLGPREIAACFVRGAALARAAVAHPQEGTMLTVADASAEAATAAAADDDASLVEVVTAGLEAARVALARTPEQLPSLAEAGVVDAGGAGVVLLLEALHRVLSGDWTGTTSSDLGGGGQGLPRRAEWRVTGTGASAGSTVTVGEGPRPQAEASHGGPAYEVMFLLEESDAARVATLTGALDALGDSLIVVGGPDLWNVHVHVDDVGAAIESGIDAGRPRRIRVTNFAHQIGAATDEQAIGVVACAAGPGLEAILRDAGAVTVASAPGARASTGQLLEAARRTGAHVVLLLPNDKDTVMAAEAAVTVAAHEGIAVHVIPSRTAVQGLAALAVHDPSASLQSNVVAMTSAARATKHGAVTVAVKEALTWGGHCVPGDVLGIVDGDIVIVGHDLATVARDVLGRLLGSGGELVTLVTGRGADPELVSGLEGVLLRDFPEVEVSVLEGGQTAYPLLIGVE